MVRCFATVVFSPRHSESKLSLCSRLNENVVTMLSFSMKQNRLIYTPRLSHVIFWVNHSDAACPGDEEVLWTSIVVPKGLRTE